jgi:hypothetical protein
MITQNAKKRESFPKRGPHDSYPLLIAFEIPATTPTESPMKFNRRRVVRGINRVVHLDVYSYENSSSSPAFDVTVKLVSIPARTLRRPWNTAILQRDVQKVRNTTDDPELLVSPLVIDGHTTPSHFKDPVFAYAEI